MGINYFRRDDRDIKFVLFQYLDIETILNYEPYRDFSVEDLHMVIDEALKVAREVIGPSLQDGDREGVKYENGVVRVPKSFHECWKVLSENGWIGITSNPRFGGQGFPMALGGMVGDIFNGANMAFMNYPGLTVGAAHLIENFGTDTDRNLFVKKMYSGTYSGTMCLTEPDAGSDVGWLKTKAIPDKDSQDPRIYTIQGNKQFITCGEHDLTENIIHLVLARIEGAPHGTKGLSLFIVPKIWVNPDGSMAGPNGVFCAGVEHKMGIHGSATCALTFGENQKCRGILLGEPNTGMAKMFQMMNEARMGCGIQALGITASAYDIARTYAKERIQGPPFTNRKGDRVPIIQHEDVRRMLMNLKAGSEGMRALIARLYYFMDISKYDPDETRRNWGRSQVELFTPLVKAYCSDLGYLLTREAIQVLGGVGFCSDFPAEQYARDIKIVSIWEGTNYIQALDLVGRKLGMDQGRVFREWVEGVINTALRNKEDHELGTAYEVLYEAAKLTSQFPLKYIQFYKEGRPRLIPLTATRFLECFAEVLMAHMLLEQAEIARNKLKGPGITESDALFYKGKIYTARYFAHNILPNVFARAKALHYEDTSAIDIPEECF